MPHRKALAGLLLVITFLAGYASAALSRAHAEPQPAFDVLYWNIDSTRVPEALHRFCLRELYLKNRLAQKDAVVLGGHPIDFARITQPLYAVGAEEDHITPWRGTFNTARLVSAPVRYVLSSSGHILGIINPPVTAAKRWYRAGDWAGEEDGQIWRNKQKTNQGSWWKDWIAWLQPRCGALRSAPPLGNHLYRPLGDAPGSYVFET